MIDQLISGGSGGGVKIDSNPVSRAQLDVAQSFDARFGGNAGITFGRNKTTAVVYGVVAVAVVAAAVYAMKRRG